MIRTLAETAADVRDAVQPGSLGAIKIRLAEAVYDCVPMGVDTSITILERTHTARDEILLRFDSYPGGGEPINPSRWYRITRWFKRTWST